MKISGKLKYSKAIIVDDELLRGIDAVITEYYKEAKYSANLRNGDKIEFGSLDELLNYDNFGTAEIKSLIVNYDYNSLCFDVGVSLWTSYGSTVEATFCANSGPDCENIKRRIIVLLEKASQGFGYRILSKLSIMQIALPLFVLGMGLLSYAEVTIGLHDEIWPAHGLLWWEIVFGFSLMICFVYSKLNRYFYPPIVFSLGENIKKYQALQNTKSHIFWGVVVAMIVSMVVSIFVQMVL